VAFTVMALCGCAGPPGRRMPQPDVAFRLQSTTQVASDKQHRGSRLLGCRRLPPAVCIALVGRRGDCLQLGRGWPPQSADHLCEQVEGPRESVCGKRPRETGKGSSSMTGPAP
jgi:hypothetical protein